MISNNNIYNSDFTSVSDWVLQHGTGANGYNPVATTFNGESSVFFNTGVTAGWSSMYKRFAGSFLTRTVVSFNVYFDNIGATGGSDVAYFKLDVAGYSAQTLGPHFSLHFATNGLFVQQTPYALLEVGSDLVVLDVWQEWTFDISWLTSSSGTVDVYLNKVLVGNDITFGGQISMSLYEGRVTFTQYGTTTLNCQTYIDWLKIGTNELISFLKVRNNTGETLGIQYEPVESKYKFRIRKGGAISGTTYGLPLVATTHPFATPIRVFDGITIKALKKT